MFRRRKTAAPVPPQFRKKDSGDSKPKDRSISDKDTSISDSGQRGGDVPTTPKTHPTDPPAPKTHPTDAPKAVPDAPLAGAPLSGDSESDGDPMADPKAPAVPQSVPAQGNPDPEAQQDISHCPFCGARSLIGRSDGAVECGFCDVTFQVSVMPTFNNMPYSVDGEPYVPDEEYEDSLDGGDAPEDEVATAVPDTPVPDDPDPDTPTPNYAKLGVSKLYRTHTGALLYHDDYVDYLALQAAKTPGQYVSRVARLRADRAR